MELTSSHKYIQNSSTCGTTLTEHLLNTGRRPQISERARKSPCNRVGQKKKEKKKDKGIGTGPAPLGGSCEGEKFATLWEVPSLVGRSARMEGELQSLGGEHRNWSAGGKTETCTNGWCCHPALPSLRRV